MVAHLSGVHRPRMVGDAQVVAMGPLANSVFSSDGARLPRLSRHHNLAYCPGLALAESWGATNFPGGTLYFPGHTADDAGVGRGMVGPLAAPSPDRYDHAAHRGYGNVERHRGVDNLDVLQLFAPFVKGRYVQLALQPTVWYTRHAKPDAD